MSSPSATGGGSTGYVLRQPELTFDLGLLVWTRFEWPVPQVDDTGDAIQAGVGDLQWLTLGVRGWRLALLTQQLLSFAADPQRSRVSERKLQPYATKLLPDSWYIQTKPVIAIDFAHGTSSVPLDLVGGRVVNGRWNVFLGATVYPGWTSPPSADYKLTPNIGYLFPSPLARP